MSLRRRTWEILEAAKPGDTVSRVFDVFILSLIFVNVLAAIFGTVPEVEARWGSALGWFEVISVAVFTVEYAGRIWSCTEDPRYRLPVRGRLRFARSGMSVIDLVAIVPFYLPLFGVDMRSARALRLLRVLRIAKVGRYSRSLRMIGNVVRERKEELVLTTGLMLLLLVLTSSVVYYCEHEAQPERFSSIPATMWWSVATLTTVGYGDMYPVTVLGKLFGSLAAVMGIGMFALPTGILGAAFVEEIRRGKLQAPAAANEQPPGEACRECGRRLD